MISPISVVQALVRTPDSAVASPWVAKDPFIARLANALKACARNDVGPGDLAALVRQAVWRAHLCHGEVPEIRVPAVPPWPTRETWEAHGCFATRTGDADLLVTVCEWSPGWLDERASEVVNDATREVKRRATFAVRADPGVQELTGYDTNNTRGQREAVRAAVLMGEGATLIINLPTGAGKTLAFQVPALTWAGEGGLTVVVVPTTALARDQEERFHELCRRVPSLEIWANAPLAYHGGVDDEVKRAIRNAIRAGTQPILFSSPEALLGSLRGSLFDAARAGTLRYLAIDEAHIVAQWGQQFRPEFQSLAGLRSALLRVCPTGKRFRTLLLSATLTQDTYAVLAALFAESRPMVVAEPMIRPEPGYLIGVASGPEQRTNWIAEAMRFLPRPAILYTTTRDDASEWAERLAAAGNRRVGLVRGGDMSTGDGTELIRRWRARELDVVVATSAFGLGMDQADTRSVVHACLPESIDRYYQEVGRGGRDGNASVALIVSTPQDREVAVGLAQKRLISVDRALERWEAMWLARRRGEAGDYIVSLDHAPADLLESGEYNRAWNLRTLVLMAGAGLIRFSSHEPPALQEASSALEGEAAERANRIKLESFAAEVAISLRDANHLNPEHWQNSVDKLRSRLKSVDQESLTLVQELRSLSRPLNELFRSVYTLQDPPVQPPRYLGSCLITRKTNSVGFDQVPPDCVTDVTVPITVGRQFLSALQPGTDQHQRVWIGYDAPPSDLLGRRACKNQRMTLLRFAVASGIAALDVPVEALTQGEWRQLSAAMPSRFLIRDEGDSSGWKSSSLRLARLSFVENGASKERFARVAGADVPYHVIVVPLHYPDPSRPDRQFLSVQPHLLLEQAIERLETWAS